MAGKGGARQILFVPVSGSAGSGEVQRCSLLADTVHASAPGIVSHFLLADDAPAVAWPVTTLTDSPTRAVAEVEAAIRAVRPAVVVFDGNARVATMRAARAVGARVVLVSSRPSARKRGFRLRRMACLCEHWLVGADVGAARGWRERLGKWARPGVAVRRFSTLFALPGSRLGTTGPPGLAGPYVVVCPGSGQHALADCSSAELFGRAATILAAKGVTTVAVAAPAAPPAIDAGSLDNAELMALLAQADGALLGGGSLLVQALALGVPVLAFPLQEEQAARVAWLADRDAVVQASAADAKTLAGELHDLFADAPARERLRRASAALELHNGLEKAVAALVALAGPHRDR